MPQLITDITTPNWQLSNKQEGAIVTDGDDILQCIVNILYTQQGEVPFDPFFGSRIYRNLDAPINMLVPGTVSDIYDAVTTWEKRVRLNRIGVNFGTNYELQFTLEMTVIASASALSYTLDFINANKTGGKAFSYGYSNAFI